MDTRQKENIRITPEAYLELERTSQIKHEYLNGETFAMTGGSLNHNQINGNIFNQLKNRLRGSSCRPFTNDMRVKIDEINKYTYPDIAVVCGEIELERIKGVETLLNPIVIIEILSNATELYDRGKKFRHYRQIDSLQEYILVSQYNCLVERFVRGDKGIWQILTPYTHMAQSINIEAIDCELKLSDVYELVEFKV